MTCFVFVNWLNSCEGSHKKMCQFLVEEVGGVRIFPNKSLFLLSLGGWGSRGGDSRKLWVFFHNLAIFYGSAIPFTCIWECTIVQHVIISKKTFSFKLWVYYTHFSSIFRAIKRSKLELPQINMQFNFDQFRALNFQNRTNGSKVMVILPLQVQFWKYKAYTR